MEIDYFEIIKTNANVKLLSSNIYDIFQITTLKEGMPHVQRFDINFRILHPAVPNDSLIFFIHFLQYFPRHAHRPLPQLRLQSSESILILLNTPVRLLITSSPGKAF